MGWAGFCNENKIECDAKPSESPDAVLTPNALAELEKVNKWVNENIKPTCDLDHYGVLEKWAIPTDGKGDCEDFALLKRRMLMQAGWPHEALLITLVDTEHGVSWHAVLMIKTDKGDFILSNEFPDVRLWWKLPYRYYKRQSQRDPNIWVLLEGDK